MSLDETMRRSISRAGIVRVRNALNPILWTCAVMPGPSWLAAFAFRDDIGIRDLLVGFGCLPFLVTSLAYFIYMFRDPDRLQSEEFVLRQQELSLIEHKGLTPPELPSKIVDQDDSKAFPPPAANE